MLEQTTDFCDLYKQFLLEDPYVFNPPLLDSEAYLPSQNTKKHSIVDSTGQAYDASQFVADYRCSPEPCSTAAGIFGYYGVPYLTHHALSDLQMQQQPFCQEMGIAPSALHGAPASSCHDSQTISAPPKGPALEDTRSPTSRAVLLPIGDRAQTFERAARGAATSLAGNQWEEKMQRHMADKNSVSTLCGSSERKSAPSISRSSAPTKQRSPRARVGRTAITRVTRRTTKETDVGNLNCTEGHDIDAEMRALLSRVYVDNGGLLAREASSAGEDVLLPSMGAMQRHPTVGSTTVQDIPTLADKTAFNMRCAPPPRHSSANPSPAPPPFDPNITQSPRRLTPFRVESAVAQRRPIVRVEIRLTI
ncbi:hypothetical protein C2E23DRAFT_931364 [Lenzites betulinus]|nr:hypothetical protein C2E23DRAFT_931364 [Lenzites betulinus]